MPPPTITLATLAHVGAQPLAAYLYLSQIPYTGLELSIGGTILYWIILVGCALVLAYLTLFDAIPLAIHSINGFGSRVSTALNAPGAASAPASVAPAAKMSAPAPAPAAPRGYSAYEGFKSFGRDGAISIDDIVKGLSRHHPSSARQIEPPTPNVEPIYENVEPIEPAPAPSLDASARELIFALLAGDRGAVFEGLRRHVQSGASAESLLSEAACLLDDAFRARVDGTSSDDGVARRAAHVATPSLEKLVAALATAIDTSYAMGITGAKLALIRALAILGA